jgi:hypothetical protein
LRNVHAAAVEAGAADLSLLLLDGRPISGCYGYVSEGRLEIARIDADPAVGTAAMTALLGRIVRDGIERGDSDYTLTDVPEKVSATWETSSRPTAQYSCFRLCSLPGRLHALAFYAGWILGQNRNTAPTGAVRPIPPRTADLPASEAARPFARPCGLPGVSLRVVT